MELQQVDRLNFEVQQAAVDQLIENAVHHPELLDELHIDGAPELRPHPLHRGLQRAPQFGGLDLLVADLGDRGRLIDLLAAWLALVDLLKGQDVGIQAAGSGP